MAHTNDPLYRLPDTKYIVDREDVAIGIAESLDAEQ